MKISYYSERSELIREKSQIFRTRVNPKSVHLHFNKKCKRKK